MEYIEIICTSIELLKNSWASIREWCNYRELLDEKKQTLERKMKELESRKKDVNDELRNAVYGKKPRSEVDNWLKDVSDKTTEVQDVEQKARKRRYLSRSRFLRLVDKKIEEVIELIGKGSFPEGLLIDDDQRREALPTTPLVGETTAARNLEIIWKFLMDDETIRIGVHGMGGVGKTTITTHIHNRLLENLTSADHVYWVTVSQESSIHKLQNEIAKCIKLDLSNEDDEMRRKTKLFNALRGRKKFVVILDDMWKVFLPEDIGIPIGVNTGKLLITTRILEVCRGMKCQQTIRVDTLSGEEAWDLFKKNVGSDKVLDQEVEEIARSIVKECAGLPLAIVTTARSMTGANDIHDWRNALDELRESIKGLIDMEGQVFKILKFSYDRLNDKILQQCLLYCASFPEDSEIERVELIVRWIAEGLIDERRSRKAKYDRGHSILNKLENACLLESARDRNGMICVKMHDVVRDMALNITKENGNGPPIFMVKSGAHRFEWSENLERVFLFGDSIEEERFPISPKCPKLLTLLLHEDCTITKIPDSFFVHMHSLRVLDLSGTQNLKRLPDSISNLKSLRGLFLNRCFNLEYVPSLAELKELRELHLQWSGVKAVPEGLEGLVNLKCLDLYCARGIQSIPTGLLSKLSHLQCLRLDNCEKVDVQTEELNRLTQLEMLGVHFSDLHKFNSYVNAQHWQTLTHYRLQLRYIYGDRPLRCKQVSIKGYNHCGEEERDHGGIVLPTNMQELIIDSCVLPRSLLDFSPSLKKKNAWRDLERFLIHNSKGIEHLWSSTTSVVPQNLQILLLLELPDLTSLFKYDHEEGVEMGGGPPAPALESGTFSLLKQLIVSGCHNLKYLLTPWLVRHHFQNLQLIRVCDCSEMAHIIRDDDEDDKGNSIITFPKLQNLALIKVPKLKSIRRGFMDCPSLQEIKVSECPMLKRLPLPLPTMRVDDHEGQTSSETSTTHLKAIRGEKEWWDLLEWDTLEAKSNFQPLFSVCPPLLDHFSDTTSIWWKDFDQRYEEVK